jgi:hypothetical protein
MIIRKLVLNREKKLSKYKINENGRVYLRMNIFSFIAKTYPYKCTCLKVYYSQTVSNVAKIV